MNAWFGTPWGAPVCDDLPQVPTPVGESCLHCDEPIEDGDRGMVMPYVGLHGTRDVPVHLACQMRSVLGGAACIEGTCSRCGDGSNGQTCDPPGLSRREAAIAAVAAWERVHG